MKCLECQREFVNGDSKDDRFCGKWCDKAWSDREYEKIPTNGSKSLPFYVPDTAEVYNRGLGCVTKGTRHTERTLREINKQRRDQGKEELVAVGNENMDKHWQREAGERDRRFDRGIRQEYIENIRRQRARLLRDASN